MHKYYAKSGEGFTVHFDLGDEENTFESTKVTFPFGKEKTYNGTVTLAQLQEVVHGPEIANAILLRMEGLKAQFEQECFQARVRGDPPPTWYPLWQ